MTVENLEDALKTATQDEILQLKDKGNEFAKLGQYSEAVQCYTKAIKINPDYADAWNNLGLVLNKLGKIDEAKRVNEHLQELKSKESSQNPFSTPIQDSSPPIMRKSDPHYTEEHQGEVLPHPKRPDIAAVLSAVFPGLGQVYNGENMKGVIFFLGFIVGVVVMVIPGIIVWGVGIWEAFRTARLMNAGEIPLKPTRKKNMVFFVGSIVTIFFIFILAAFINGMQPPYDYPVNVNVNPTPDGFQLVWDGGTDISHAVGWKVFDASSNNQAVFIDGTGNKPTLGQVDKYSGGSVKGKRVLIFVWFDDGTELVVYDRQF